MTTLHAFTSFERPGLHLWRPGTDARISLRPVDGEPGRPGWWRFAYEWDPQGGTGELRFLLFDGDKAGGGARAWEPDVHQRAMPRSPDGGLPADVWCFSGSARVVTDDPFARQAERLRLHLITADRYRGGSLFLWDPQGEERIAATGADPDGNPYWELALEGSRRSFLRFKFLRPDGAFEPDYANRVWVAADGDRVWTHSEAAALSGAPPTRAGLRVHLHQPPVPGHPPVMRVWQRESGWSEDIAGRPSPGDWTSFDARLYTELPYGVRFHNPGLPKEWEHEDISRDVRIAGDTELWTLEGANRLFEREPARDRQVRLEVAAAPPGSPLGPPWSAEVAVDRARSPMYSALPAQGGSFSFLTYPGVVTSVRLRSAAGAEGIDRHPVPEGDGRFSGHLVVGRAAVLPEPPPADLFTDPPFLIERPGAYERSGQLRFALHAPGAALAQVVGEWTGWDATPLPMRSTRDGTYWWAQVPVDELQGALPGGRPHAADGDYHGTLYKFVVDGRMVQDPAAGWVESSAPASASRLLRPGAFTWSDAGWRIPDRDHLIVYQLHPGRFSNRFGHLPPLDRVAREVDDPAGYLRDLGVTALLLMPVNEVATRNSWGYDPAFFYAIEEAYGGPEALKRLVDTCHRHGIAVLLDVVFNHAGTADNALWTVAPESYFAGDTEWGAMVNFRHPQSRHFFEQNLVYLQREFHVDGFRLDHTFTILHSDEARWPVRRPGPGGGWEFLHGLRHALHTQADGACHLMAEHLPNEWGVTNFGGPMDTQWCDAFHDNLELACRRLPAMDQLREALLTTHQLCDEWFNATNYAESHDEVGNEPDRVANLAGFGQGLRMAKVAGAAALLSRGIPMLFMGAEAGEWRQFRIGDEQPLDLDSYLREPGRRVRDWWRALFRLRDDDNLRGPAPLAVHFAADQLLALSRGQAGDFFAVLNFGGWSGRRSLAQLNLPDGRYQERLNSTWPEFAVEHEDTHGNGGAGARLHRGDSLEIPDYGIVVLRRT